MAMYRKRGNPGAVPTHIVSINQNAIDLDLFYEYIMSDPVIMAAHPLPPNTGRREFYKNFREISASKPEILKNIIYEYWDFSLANDPIMQAFPSRLISTTTQMLETTRVVIEPQLADAAVRGTPARIISSTIEKSSVRLMYYAQGFKFEGYALKEVEGAEMFGLQLLNLIANMAAAVKHHIVAVPIQTTPCYYLAPSRLSATLKVPVTAEDHVYMWSHFVNAFGKTQRSMATILRLFSDAMARNNVKPGRILVPQSQFPVLFKGDRSRYLYTVQGEDNKRIRKSGTGVVLPGETDLLLGLEAIPTISTELNSGYDETARSMVSNDFRSGSIFIHLKQFAAMKKEKLKQTNLLDTVASPSWFTNADDYYPYYLTAASDISFIQPSEVGFDGPVWRGFEGLPNRPLLDDFAGKDHPTKGAKDFAKQALESQKKVMQHFRDHRITPPNFRPNDPAWNELSPLLDWNKTHGFFYPALVIADMPCVLEADEKLMNLAMDMFHDALYAGVNISDSLVFTDKKDEIMFNDNLARLTWAHPHPIKGVTLKYEMMSGSDFQFNEMHAWTEAQKQYGDFYKAGRTHEYCLAAALKVLDTFMYDDSANSTRNLCLAKYTNGLNDKQKHARMLYLMQPIGVPFFKKCHDNNIFVPFSGAIVRLSEKSEATTPVLLAEGAVGESYVQPVNQRMTFASESVEGFVDMGMDVGASADPEKFLPMLFTITGGINVKKGGSGNKFMVYHPRVLQAIGDTFVDRMENVKKGYNNPALEVLRNTLLNQPEECDEFTNLAIFQGPNCCKVGVFPQVIDITGRYHHRSFSPYCSPHDKLFQERPKQLFPGSVFHAWALRSDKIFRVPPENKTQVYPSKYSCIQIQNSRRWNTVAALADCLLANSRGIFERRAGMHIRGRRIPGQMFQMDNCNTYVSN